MKTWFTDDKSWSMEEWYEVSARYHGRALTGKYAHFCNDWDDLPIDETCDEIHGCTCWGTRREV